ncbi:YfhO family protein [Geotalea sp. SG265]|uniref:YfhO family protein n=1 Tax=Geotalea sp. SG265 TaxID=2922867 RepID=UPI001FAFF363|nr:YfhO family protein [Geotalea sp. SG265]
MRNEKPGLLEKDWFYVGLMAVIVIAFCNKVLFTDQIIRASDVITQFFWGAKAIKAQSLADYLASIPTIFHANWEPLMDGGRTLEGGWNAIGLLFHRFLIQHYFPFPSSIAWLAVLSLLWGGIGTYFYCRLIGISRFGAFTAGLIFSLGTETASLINAGHIQKIEGISWLPWVLYFLERAIRSGRLFHYAMTSLMLAVQFFNMHWQISFYTCLAVGAYWFFHVGESFVSKGKGYLPAFRKDIALAVVMVMLFFTTIAMSFAPIFSWSRQSERGGGMSQEEGMSWSMPPEEILTYAVPGFFGLSRQEGGDVPAPGQVFYWGRMHFTQTNDYLGLLPWFLVPLVFTRRRERTDRFFLFLMGATLLMALGKYTFVYQFMFDHLPGFSTFRVPKMILFLFAFAVAVLTGRGVGILAEAAPQSRPLKYWLAGSGLFVTLIGLLWLWFAFGAESAVQFLPATIGEPTRYQWGAGLATDRYGNAVREAGIAFGVAFVYLAVLLAWAKRWLPVRLLLPVLVILLLGDLWRVNTNFFVLTDPPVADKTKTKNDVVAFLEKNIDRYRMQPMNEQSSAYYADFGLGNISAYVTVSEKRYREFLDAFSLTGAMPNLVNLKYLVMPRGQYEEEKQNLAGQYQPVFESLTGSVVLENRQVLPKAWLVPEVQLVANPEQQLVMMRNPYFNPARTALVETPPPAGLAPKGQGNLSGNVEVALFEPNRIVVKVAASDNALLVLGEKYYKWWHVLVDGKREEIFPVDHILRGVYVGPGQHRVEFRFDPLPFKIGKYLTLASLAFIAGLAVTELCRRRKRECHEGTMH